MNSAPAPAPEAAPRAVAGGGLQQLHEVRGGPERVGHVASAIDAERRAELTAGVGEQHVAVEWPGAVERGEALQLGGIG